jgi:hypothetical protein
VKPRSAQIDENWNALQYYLDDDRRLHARFLRRLLNAAYRALNRAMVLVGDVRSRRGALAELSHDPFNLTDEELEREWRTQK